jgi:hypothetical protein
MIHSTVAQLVITSFVPPNLAGNPNQLNIQTAEDLFHFWYFSNGIYLLSNVSRSRQVSRVYRRRRRRSSRWKNNFRDLK